MPREFALLFVASLWLSAGLLLALRALSEVLS